MRLFILVGLLRLAALGGQPRQERGSCTRGLHNCKLPRILDGAREPAGDDQLPALAWLERHGPLSSPHLRSAPAEFAGCVCGGYFEVMCLTRYVFTRICADTSLATETTHMHDVRIMCAGNAHYVRRKRVAVLPLANDCNRPTSPN